MKKTSLIIFTITLILNACTTPPTPTPIPTATLAPPTQTPLPPTPDLDDILPLEIAEEYTLATDNNETFYLQDKDGNIIPEISIDIDRNIFFGEENMPADLRIEGEQLLISQDGKTLIFDGKEWTHIPKLPEDLPNNWAIADETHIVDKDGNPLFVFVETVNEANDETLSEEVAEGTTNEGESGKKEGAWIKDFPRVDILQYDQCKSTIEDYKKDGPMDQHIQRLIDEITPTMDWKKIKNDIVFTMINGFLVYSPDFDHDSVQFDNEDTNPFIRRKDGFFCELTHEGNKYLGMIYLVLDNNDNRQKIYPIKLALPLHRNGVPLSEWQISDQINTWINKMNVSVIGVDDKRNEADKNDSLFFPTGSTDQKRISDVFRSIWNTIDPSPLELLKDDLLMTDTIDIPDENWYR